MQIIVTVLFPQSWSNGYDYIWSNNEQPQIGMIVLVPLKNINTLGIIININSNTQNIEQNIKLKTIISIHYWHFNPKNIEFLKKISNETFSSLGATLKLFWNNQRDQNNLSTYYVDSKAQAYTIEQLQNKLTYQTMIKSIKNKEYINIPFIDIIQNNEFKYLTSDQSDAVSSIIDFYYNKFDQQICLLEGATGSGKTEVYLESIGQIFFSPSMKKNNIKILILVPEISLTQAFLKRFEKRFGIFPMVWHCKISAKIKNAIFFWALNPDESGIVIGARSALFLPFSHINLIIVDEEHDGTYKQNDSVRYHTKACIESLCSIFSTKVIYISATPSLDYALEKNFLYLKLQRQQECGQAQVQIIDMKNEKGWLSQETISSLKENFAKKQLSLLFLNRKGFAPLIICKRCGERLMCKRCSVGLVYYKSGIARCHYCNYSIKPSDTCKCGNAWTFTGPGIEKISELVSQILPEAKILCVSSQMSKTQMQNLYKTIKDYDVLIGTQILAQGHHIEALTFVAILDCDFGLSSSDYKGSERTYQMLTQVKGRAGRGSLPGKCILQTFYPEHPLIQHFANNTLDQWLPIALKDREIFNWPPYCKLLCIILESKDQLLAQAYTKMLFNKLEIIYVKDLFYRKNLEILGPTPSPIFQIKQQYRYRFLIKYNDFDILHKFITLWIEQDLYKVKNLKIILDNLPENFL